MLFLTHLILDHTLVSRYSVSMLFAMPHNYLCVVVPTIAIYDFLDVSHVLLHPHGVLHTHNTAFLLAQRQSNHYCARDRNAVHCQQTVRHPGKLLSDAVCHVHSCLLLLALVCFG